MTKPTAGVPHHPPPVITRVEFDSTAGPDSRPAEKYSAHLLARTVGHLDYIPVGALIGSYLEVFSDLLRPGHTPLVRCTHPGEDEICQPCRDKYAPPPTEIAELVLALSPLVDAVIEQARVAVHNGLMADIATTLIPRLKGTRSV